MHDYETSPRRTSHEIHILEQVVEDTELTEFKNKNKYANVKPENEERVQFQLIGDGDSICSESSDDALPPIPDGGWGWVVVASAFLISACADGLAFSFGLLHEEFTIYFQTTQSKTSLIGSFFIATPLLAGPIMSALVDKYGCRLMTMIAGVVSTAGFLLAALSDSVEMLCLTFGLLSGLAMGILYVTPVVAVAFWFEKRRNLAVSLASCGVGFGTVIYSPMTHYFLEIYDWRNTIIILSGTVLNMCVCGALMRDPDWLIIKQRISRASLYGSNRSSSAASLSSRSVGGESVYMDKEELEAILKSGKSPEHILATLATSIAKAENLQEITEINSQNEYQKTHSAIHLPTFIQHREKVPTEVIEKIITNKRLYNIILSNYPEVFKIRRHSETKLIDPKGESSDKAKLPVDIKLKKPKEITDKLEENESKKDSKEKTKKSIFNIRANKSQPWLHRQQSIDRHYLRDLPLYRNSMMHRGAVMNMQEYRRKATSLPNIHKNSSWSLSTESDDELYWYEKCWMPFKKSFEFSMLLEFHFLMFNISSLVLSVWFIVPYFFLQTYMTSLRLDAAPTMISVIGVANAIGIVVLGWSGDQPYVNVPKLYAGCLITCGLSLMAFPPFIDSFWPLAVVSAVFGLSFASSYSFIPAMLTQLMPIDYFTVSYGLILLSEGIGHLVGPPLAGFLYDMTESWALTFYVAGLWVVVSGLCVGVVATTTDFRICGDRPLLRDLVKDEKLSRSSNA